MAEKREILCVGEVLWDSLPDGLFLGGAPLNVAFHLRQLGEESNILSRVGNDRLGKEAFRRIELKNLPINLIQKDPNFETGIVEVQLDEKDNPAYDIIAPVAWDEIELTDQAQSEASKAWAIVFGSLAQRNKKSRETIHSLLNLDDDMLKVCDINLRPPFYDRELIKKSISKTDILKLNEAELDQLIEWFSLSKNTKEAIKDISHRFNCNTICMTKGREGAVLLRDGKWAEHSGFKVEVKDAVGAGDAFLAALLQGLHVGKETEQIIIFANAAGAFVASKSGATPEYTQKSIEQFITEHPAAY